MLVAWRHRRRIKYRREAASVGGLSYSVSQKIRAQPGGELRPSFHRMPLGGASASGSPSLSNPGENRSKQTVLIPYPEVSGCWPLSIQLDGEWSLSSFRNGPFWFSVKIR